MTTLNDFPINPGWQTARQHRCKKRNYICYERCQEITGTNLIKIKAAGTTFQFYLSIRPLASPPAPELSQLFVASHGGPNPNSKGVSFFSVLELLSAEGFAAQALRGGSNCLLATSGGGASSPDRTRSPFSRREDGSL